MGANSYKTRTKMNRTLSEGLEILLLFDISNALLRVSEISKRLRYSISKTYRLVSTLIGYGLLREKPGTAQYCLGMKVLHLGLLARQGFNFSEIARPLMKELCALTGETILLTAVNGSKGIVLERVETEEPIRYTLYQPGASIPLHCGASGKSLMAYLDEGDWNRIIAREGLNRYTPHTITEVDRLKAHLREIRKSGYAFSDQEVERDVRAVGAPILNGFGELVAGLSIVGPVYRINKKKAGALKRWVIEYAQKISTLLG